MKRRRNSNDIEADILRIATDGARKTQIVYGANLNFRIIRKYLPRLIELGFIDHRDNLYYTTPRGHEFLRRYEAFQSMSEMYPLLEV